MKVTRRTCRENRLKNGVAEVFNGRYSAANCFNENFRERRKQVKWEEKSQSITKGHFISRLMTGFRV